MRTIDTPGSFKRDYKRENKGIYNSVLSIELKEVINSLALDQPLAANYLDHNLTGEWIGCRECHIRPDLLLIYKKWVQKN